MSEVYNRYVDTAGNYHYSDVETGHHVIRKSCGYCHEDSDWAKICKNCRYYGSVTTTDTTWYCARTIAEVDPNASCEYWKTAKQTNADRIRSMTDEELAEVIADGFCSTRPDKCNNFKRCIDCTLDWLKEEAKNNG